MPIGHGGESILFIYRVLFAVPPKVRILVSRGAGRSIGGPGASHAAQTVVFTHTGESAEKIQLVYSTIPMLVPQR